MCPQILVPVYNGTTGKFNMQILNKLNDNLKPWDREVTECLGLVGYTANC